MSDVVVTVSGSDTAVTVTETSVNIDVTETSALVEVGNSGPQGSSYIKGDPIYSLVRNATGSTLTKGTVVYTSGANGDNVQVSKAQANSDATSARTMGFIADDILNGESGYVIISGYITGIDTSGATAGQIVYLSGSIAGGWTTTKPVAPIHLVYLGVITRVNANNGSIFVHPQNGYELNEIHDVLITTPTDNQVLTYESASGLWKNKTNTVDGVQSVVFDAPLTGGTVTSAGTVGLDQSALSVSRSQVTDFAGGSVAYATTAGSASTAGAASSADYASTAGTAVYASNAGTAVGLSGDLAQSQVTNLVSDLAGKAALTADQTFTGTSTFQASSIGSQSLVAKILSGQTANVFEVQQSNGTVNALFSTGGTFFNSGQIRTGFNTSIGQLSVHALAATTVGLGVRGAASQTADLTQWQSSAGTTIGAVSATGFGFFRGARLKNGISSLSNVQFSIETEGTGVVGQIIRGAASQSANLQEWQNSAGGVLARVQNSGLLQATGIATINGRIYAYEENSGGTVRFIKQTAAAANPGANLAGLYFRDGTNAGTLKLVVRAGAAGAETTILDNIPQ